MIFITTSELMKLRFLSYVTRHYAQYDLEMTSFSYDDPKVRSFGIDNGYYTASFQSKNKQEKDIAFQVYTDGFIFSIKDSYEHQINQKWNTHDRLINAYGEDVKKALMAKYKDPIHKELEETAKKVGGHGGMDYIMDYRLVYCLRNGLPLDMDVYDLAEWCCMAELTRLSIENGSAPVEVPDFTRGGWNKVQGYRHAFAE